MKRIVILSIIAVALVKAYAAVPFPSDCGINKYQNKAPKHSDSKIANGRLMQLLRRLLGDEDKEVEERKKVESIGKEGREEEEEIQRGRRVMGGREARRGSHPWIIDLIVYMENGTTKNCGGSLIHPQWVISAAHCFYGNEEDDFPSFVDRVDDVIIVLGEHNVQTVGEEWEKEAYPDFVLIHPDYQPKVVATPGDIALIKLREPVALNDDIKVICLPEEPILDGTKCIAAGWGMDSTGNFPIVLHEVDVVKTNTTHCQTKQDEGHVIQDGMVCAAKPHDAPFADACEGDSGGPLACRINGRYILGGATSFGNQCTDHQGAAGVYADVYYFKDWIIQNIELYGN